jgi:signal transduction histidine kinase
MRKFYNSARKIAQTALHDELAIKYYSMNSCSNRRACHSLAMPQRALEAVPNVGLNVDAGSGFEIFMVSLAWVHCGRWPRGREELEIAPSFPRLEAEPRRLEQVLCNLVSNSLKFIPEGGAALVGAACNPKEIEIWVKDTSIGISANENG